MKIKVIIIIMVTLLITTPAFSIPLKKLSEEEKNDIKYVTNKFIEAQMNKDLETLKEICNKELYEKVEKMAFKYSSINFSSIKFKKIKNAYPNFYCYYRILYSKIKDDKIVYKEIGTFVFYMKMEDNKFIICDIKFNEYRI